MFPVIRSSQGEKMGMKNGGVCAQLPESGHGPVLAGIQFNDSAFVIQPGITGALSFWFLALCGREYYPGTTQFSFFYQSFEMILEEMQIK